MADIINGFYGHLSGPFEKNVQIFNILNQQSGRRINYISKLGIHCVYNFDLDIKDYPPEYTSWYPPIKVNINNKEFTIGKTGILELEDCQITSIEFLNDTDDNVYIDYQYKT